MTSFFNIGCLNFCTAVTAELLKSKIYETDGKFLLFYIMELLRQFILRGCWKCDAMTFGQCAVQGSFETCASDSDTTTGRDAVCFLEMRETNQKLQQLCTGCKSANACANLKAQNFVGSGATGGSRRAGRFNDQCKNEWFIQTLGQRYGSSQSTCRTCFATCTDNSNTGHNCFGGLNSQDAFADQ